MNERTKKLAAALVGTQYSPDGWTRMRDLGNEAHAYHRLNPYPFYHFQDWKTESRGPLPKCLPLCRDVVRKGSRWLFGKPVAVDAQEDEKAQERLRAIWQANSMPSRLVRMAEQGGVWGSQLLFWGYDPEADEPVSIKVYNPTRDARCYWDPEDRTTLLMLRLQFPFYDAADGKYRWHREDWTDETWVTYKSREANTLSVERPYDNLKEPEGEWEVESRKTNPFGIVPAWLVRNTETETPYGEGDLWDLFRVVDRVHLTFHLMDRSNQFDSEPNKVYIDADIPADEVDKPIAPGQAEAISSSQASEGKQAKVELLEVRGALRPAMRDYANDLIRMVRQTAGSVELNAEDITNKGNLTRQVLSLIYQPLIEITDEKRKLYGEDGVGKFLERLAYGLGVVGEKPFGRKPLDVTLRWPDYFPLTDEEKTMRVQLASLEETSGYMSHERNVDRIAQMEGVEDIEELEKELESDLADRQKEEERQASLAQPDPKQDAGKKADELRSLAVKNAQA